MERDGPRRTRDGGIARGRRPHLVAVASSRSETDVRRDDLLRLTTPILPPPQHPPRTEAAARVDRRTRAEQGLQARASSLSESGPSRPSRGGGHPRLAQMAEEAGRHGAAISRCDWKEVDGYLITI